MVFLKPKKKKKLTRQEEFEIMKLVLDKFLWLGIVRTGIGVYAMIVGSINMGAWFVGTGIFIMILFMIVTIREFEWIK